jgi:hypothetical protein
LRSIENRQTWRRIYLDCDGLSVFMAVVAENGRPRQAEWQRKVQFAKNVHLTLPIDSR